MTLEDRRKNIRLRALMESDYKINQDVTSPYRRFRGELRCLVDAIQMAVKHGDMTYDKGFEELLVLGVSPENAERILGGKNER